MKKMIALLVVLFPLMSMANTRMYVESELERTNSNGRQIVITTHNIVTPNGVHIDLNAYYDVPQEWSVMETASRYCDLRKPVIGDRVDVVVCFAK